MSSRQLEEMQELRRDEMLANAIGTNLSELKEHEWDIDENLMSDDTVGGYIVTFAEGTDPEFLKQVGAYPEGWRSLSINAFDEPDHDDSDHSDS